MSGGLAVSSVAVLEFFLDNIPKGSVNDGFVMIGYGDHILFAFIGLLCMGKVIRCNGFLLDQVTDILFITQDPDNMAAAPDDTVAEGFVSGFPELSCDNGCTLLFNSVLVKNQSDKVSAFRIDCQFSVADIITEQGGSKDHALFHLACLPPFYSG